MNPRVSVIISAYNRPARLRRALASVLAQTNIGEIEVIVCDNGSPGEEQRSLLDEIERAGSAKVIRGPVEPPAVRASYCPVSRMINRALGVARGSCIRYLLDSDEYTPRSCEVLLGYLDTHPECGLVWGMVVPVRGGVEQRMTAEYHQMAPKLVADLMQRMNVINHNSAMHRVCRSRWDERAEAWKMSDWLFWLRLLEEGFRFDNISFPVERYDLDGRMGASRVAAGKTVADSLRERA